MKTFSGRKASQHPDELGPFIDLLRVRGVRAYLEIGARHGDTFHAVMSALPPGSCGVAVDLPGGAWGVDSSRNDLILAAADLRAQGYEIRTVFGDSQGDDVFAMVLRSLAIYRIERFDACLIDGDHRYAGVLADWQRYGGLATLVALHDIAGDGQIQPTSKLPVEVPQFWRDLKAGIHRVPHVPVELDEFVAPGSTMGIGVVIQPREAATPTLRAAVK